MLHRMWLLIMDSCGGHELLITQDGVRIEFLTQIGIATDQPSDLAGIASGKICYLTRLLKAVLNLI